MVQSQSGLQFRVDLKILPPVVLAMLIGSWIILLERNTERFLLMLVLLTPFYYLGAEILARKIFLDSKGVTVKKLFRESKVSWGDISYVDSLKAGRKVFLIIESGSAKPILLTNTLGQFQNLVHSIIRQVSTDKVSESARDLVNETPKKYGPSIQAWAVALLLSAILIGKLMGYG
ncbi:MAG: hypothetical protein AB7V04_13085 [Desulfomonilaceae bacterium]